MFQTVLVGLFKLLGRRKRNCVVTNSNFVTFLQCYLLLETFIRCTVRLEFRSVLNRHQTDKTPNPNQASNDDANNLKAL